MTSRSFLTWDSSDGGILVSGWRPYQSGDFSFETRSGEVIAVYEDLRPGPIACILFCLPPLIAFAPCCCPMLSITSRAFYWKISYCPKTQAYNCTFRRKSFLSEEIHTFYGIKDIRLESKQKAHTFSDSEGGTKVQTITVHQVILEHDLGFYEFPSDIPFSFQLQGFVNSVRHLLNPCIGISHAEASKCNSPLQVVHPCVVEDYDVEAAVAVVCPNEVFTKI